MWYCLRDVSSNIRSILPEQVVVELGSDEEDDALPFQDVASANAGHLYHVLSFMDEKSAYAGLDGREMFSDVSITTPESNASTGNVVR